MAAMTTFETCKACGFKQKTPGRECEICTAWTCSKCKTKSTWRLARCGHCGEERPDESR